ncbi:sulfate transport system permease protein [Paenibacillus sp. UNCCL117]|uniref:sulfate ABC transporter permease subunit CysT n=1 Tax=unclassified Paenibacillus TaxID=185978 RepID=UPI0008898F54|nr:MULTISPECIES: sulfate ABC transporter permease subunit CysT [unclassified Paenibacillus]SDC52471.1 sulfate transport system permease protein [Paenibacillus sp. cl123]SFW11307.1 sulfate transport system permease protein [Paenibacillus sp. UNCCL117]
MRIAWKERSILPGFGLSMGFTVLYLSLIVLFPLSAIFIKTSGMGWADFWATVTDERVVASLKLSFGTAFAAAFVNAVFGFIVAWVLVRYSFAGKRVVDALVDLPFALPTAVAGIALTTIYSQNGWVGKLLEPYGFRIVFTPLGITLALTFIGIPFVVRTLQPVIEELEKEVEEASASLGAGRWRTFRTIIFPALLPALLTGFTLAFARGVGEYGSVVFIAGNMPMRTEIAPLLIMTKLEQYNYAGATAIALVMLVISFATLFIINLIQWRANRRMANV